MSERTAYASVEDVCVLFRPLTPEESARCAELLPVVSDLLRQAAANIGRDLDAMIAAGEIYGTVVKAVTVDVTARVLRQATTGEPMSQESQTALGYNWQGTFAIPGGGIANAIMNNDLKRLGLIRKQRIGGIELYDPDHGRYGTADAENADGN
jgi:hypothetical protein